MLLVGLYNPEFGPSESGGVMQRATSVQVFQEEY